MCICTYVGIYYCRYVCLCVCKPMVRIHMCPFRFVGMYVYIRVHVWMYVCVDTCLHGCMIACMDACMLVGTYMHWKIYFYYTHNFELRANTRRSRAPLNGAI